MNRQAVAKELLGVAKELVALKSDFQVVKMLQLKREGATRDSLENARRIKEAGYLLVDGTFTYDSKHIEWITEARFRWVVDGSTETHTFNGFSFGYHGEGPRGLQEFLKMFGWHPNDDKIFSNTFGSESGRVDLRAF